MSKRKFVSNGAVVYGNVAKKIETDKAVTIVLDAGTSHPRIVVFNSAKKFADKVNEGDFVKAECTVQEVKGPKKGVCPRTLACNRITSIDEKDRFAKFSIYGRPVSVNRINDESAFAIIKCVAGKNNYLRLNFKGTVSEVDEFMNISPDNYINFKGDIVTSSPRTNYRDELNISTYRNVRPRD